MADLYIENISLIYTAFKATYEDELKEWSTVLGSTRDLVAAILVYNVMIHKFPTCKADSDKRQAVKDTKKNIRHKFGEAYQVPEAS